MDKEQISDAVRDYLDEHDIRYEYHAENHNLTMGFSLDCKLKNLRMWWDFLDKGYILYGISPINASPDNLGEVLKYAAMINYGLIPGNIEVDVSDGEIRSKTWVPLGDAEKLSEDTIQSSLGFTFTVFERFGNGFAALALGFSDAETEYKKTIEPASDEEE